MDIADRYQLIADETGLTLGQVGAYLVELVTQPDGDLVAYFGIEAGRDQDVSCRLPKSRAVRISKEKVEGYERGNG
ncbi:hypothetical protein [Pseudomonas asiatica]|uniref:hypothetical protein n=1 Tax=Pseudomonas asiatica TaxID=2219225 RepID=UPI003877D0B3